MPYWYTKFERNQSRRRLFSWLKVIVLNWYEEEKCEENRVIFKNVYLKLLNQFHSNVVCKVVYMEGIKCVNLIEIGPVVIEI